MEDDSTLHGIYMSDAKIDSLFSSTCTFQQDQLDNLAKKALQNGIDSYTKGDYDKAIKEFKRSIGLSPYSDYSIETHHYAADAYLKIYKVNDAINIYKQAIRLFPSDDSSHLNLGTVYYSHGRYKEAEGEYELAVRLNPSSPVNRYALGQTYLTNGDYTNAEIQLKMVRQLSPQDPNAYDALGQVYRNLGRYDDAVPLFQKAIALKKDFTDAYLNMGYTYADMKKFDEAQKNVDYLSEIDTQKATDLQNYITQVSDPKFTAVYTLDRFIPSLGPGTKVSSLDSDLSTPDSSKEFTLEFLFSKDMDKFSTENPFNWQISRATGKNMGGPYNWGLPLSGTEVSVGPQPMKILYDTSDHTAKVTFTLTQNSSGNGTIDPSHIVFRFYGKDAYGNMMDPKGDEYIGISKIV